MHGVVSLLDGVHQQAIADLWDELEQTCGIKRLREILPYPHVSYHVAEEYDFDRLDGALTRLAATSAPFVVQTTGVGIFTGASPVLYLAVVRNPELTRYQQRVGRRWPRHTRARATWISIIQTGGCHILRWHSTISTRRRCQRLCACWVGVPSRGISR